MLFKRNKTKQKNILVAPIEGEIKAIEEMPDEIFASKMLGDGVCVLPKNGMVYSPIEGIVRSVSPTLHAIGIEGNDGVEIIIHFGVDTVQMNGTGFKVHVKQNSSVSTKQLLFEANLNEIKKQGYSIATAIVISNSDKFKINQKNYGNAQACESILFEYSKI